MNPLRTLALTATFILGSSLSSSAQIPFGDVVMLSSSSAGDELSVYNTFLTTAQDVTSLPSNLWGRIKHIEVDSVSGDLIVGADWDATNETEIWRLKLNQLDVQSAVLIAKFGTQSLVIDSFREKSGSTLFLIADPSDPAGAFVVSRVGLTSQGEVVGDLAHIDSFPPVQRSFVALGAREDGDVVIVYKSVAFGKSKAFRVSSQGGTLIDASDELSSVGTLLRGIGFVEMPTGPEIVEAGDGLTFPMGGGNITCGSLVATLSCPTGMLNPVVDGIFLIEGTTDAFYAAVNCSDQAPFPFTTTTGELRRLDTANCTAVTETSLFILPTGISILDCSERTRDAAYGCGCAIDGEIPVAAFGDASIVNGWFVEIEHGTPNGIANFFMGTDDLIWNGLSIPTFLGRQCYVLQSTQLFSNQVSLDSEGYGFAIVDVPASLSIGSSIFGQWVAFLPGDPSFEVSAAIKTTVCP